MSEATRVALAAFFGIFSLTMAIGWLWIIWAKDDEDFWNGL